MLWTLKYCIKQNMQKLSTMITCFSSNRKQRGSKPWTRLCWHTRKLHCMIMLQLWQRQEGEIWKQSIQGCITYVSSRSSTNASTAELIKAAITVTLNTEIKDMLSKCEQELRRLFSPALQPETSWLKHHQLKLSSRLTVHQFASRFQQRGAFRGRFNRRSGKMCGLVLNVGEIKSERTSRNQGSFHFCHRFEWKQQAGNTAAKSGPAAHARGHADSWGLQAPTSAYYLLLSLIFKTKKIITAAYFLIFWIF